MYVFFLVIALVLQQFTLNTIRGLNDDPIFYNNVFFRFVWSRVCYWLLRCSDYHENYTTGVDMIDFKTIEVGDKVKVVGMGAPGFAQLGDTLTITGVETLKVHARRDDGKDAFFALTCGASRLELI